MTPPSRFVPKGPSYYDREDKLRLESRNGVIQAEFVFFTAQNWTPETRITPALLKKTQELAVNQIYRCAGHFRDGPVALDGGTHQPPPWEQVDGLVDQMCAYIDTQWNHTTPVHLSSYLMWRMNWIHPFFGGSGRTARAISYLALCGKLGFVLPGNKAIPELIAEDRTPYYAALRKADKTWEQGVLDLTDMEELVSSVLAEQLVQVHEKATGKRYQEPQ